MFHADLSEDVKENFHKFEQAAIIEVYPIDFGDILGEKYFGDAMCWASVYNNQHSER